MERHGARDRGPRPGERAGARGGSVLSRTRTALGFAAFTYAQFALAALAAIVLTPLYLRELGDRTYGLWFAASELLGYASLADFGAIAIVSWVVAEADGQGDRARVRVLTANALVFGVGIGVLYLAVAGSLWWLLPNALRLTAADRAVVGGPLAVVVLATALNQPLRTFMGVLVGLQDVRFTGSANLAQWLVSTVLGVVLLLRGHGLYALAVAASVPPVLASLAALVRLRVVARDALGWVVPSRAGMAPLLSGGTGAWLGALGWRLSSASDGIVLARLERTDSIAAYACTLKLSQLLLQLAWVVPDSALVGLAQLKTAGGRDRVDRVVKSMIAILLVAASGAALVVLAINPAFVKLWVGEHRFAGLALNVLLALNLVWSSAVHGVSTTAAVLGNRLRVGSATLVQGIVQIGLALVLARRASLVGLPLASALAALVTTFPYGVHALRGETHVGPRWLLREVVGPWVVRVAPLLVLAGLAGAAASERSRAWALALAPLALAFAVLVRPLLRDLPLPPAVARLLAKLAIATPTGDEARPT